MKKIAMVGLYSIPNMGDQILCDVAKYMVSRYSEKIQLVDMDVCPRYPEDYKGLEYIKYRLSRKLKTIGEKKYRYEDNHPGRYRYERFMWRLRLKRYYRRMLRNVDAVIFCGGGFLKFRTQGLNYYVEMITEFADRFGIPVMMNGVGIEGFDESDIRCRKLKEHVNRDCVKVVTTRDDIDILENGYITNKDIVTARVGDPALWTPECYELKRKTDSNVFGINVIRGSVYRDYGNESGEERIMRFYKGLISELDRMGVQWKLFSNGMPEDQEMADVLKEELSLEDDKIMPQPETPVDLLEQIIGFRGILGARLHACITAYSLDVPVTGLIWNEKQRIFAGMIDKNENFFGETELDPVKVTERLIRAADEEYDRSIRDDLREKTRSYLEGFLKEAGF